MSELFQKCPNCKLIKRIEKFGICADCFSRFARSEEQLLVWLQHNKANNAWFLTLAQRGTIVAILGVVVVRENESCQWKCVATEAEGVAANFSDALTAVESALEK